jgi:hypothetical protein
MTLDNAFQRGRLRPDPRLGSPALATLAALDSIDIDRVTALSGLVL